MRTSASLPFNDGTFKLVEKGDIIELFSGEKFVFMEMRRTKWVGKYTDSSKQICIPLFRYRYNVELKNSYAKAIVGKDNYVAVKKTNPAKLKFGDLFFIDGHKETFLYLGDKTKRTGKEQIIGKDLASGKTYNIAADMFLVKIDLNKMKKELKNA